MTGVPSYFETVRMQAAERWDQLDRDPVLAGPWHQLFKQVQSPRHVVSELLQNADDAGATVASADIQDGEFIFTHNGEDFTEEHFTSLCRFGYSNKRSLHTIGFRGIGFKSTFSIGDEVRLKTPSLSVAFRRRRFTEPIWQASNGVPFQHTEIRVTIQDEHRLRELKKNLDDWTTSPASLLFFQSIRCLKIRGQEIRWNAPSPGPIPNSRWTHLSDAPDRRVLLIQSAAEPFPDEALEEIRQERMVAVDEETDFPPCRVEIVLGMEGRLFVILPTGVQTKLPFACNAPFIQDPARVKIKDPETSPTNRWLLGRVGKLAAEAMFQWLGRDIGIKERCDAYALLPDIDRDNHSLEGNCGRIVEEACECALAERRFVLLEDGSLAEEGRSVAIPRVLLDVWPSDLISRLFTDNARPILSRHISTENRRKLVNWKCVDELSKDGVLTILELKHLPLPSSWAQLLSLWAYVAEDVVGYHYYRDHKAVRIFPSQGKDVLYAGKELVRLGEKKLLQSQDDWDFLATYLLVLNQNWPRYLAEQRRKAEEEKDEALGRQIESALKIFDAVGLGQASDVSQVIQQVADRVFDQEDCSLADCIRLAQLAAALDAKASETFQFVTRNGHRTASEQSVVVDRHGDLDAFVQNDWHETHVLHEDYTREFKHCTKNDWDRWVESGRSGLLTFLPFVQQHKRLWNRSELVKTLRERGVKGDLSFQYVTNQFILEDWDFDLAQWRRWQASAASDADFWGRLFSRILEQPASYWSKATGLRALQVATTGSTRSITQEDMCSSWIMKFRALPCLQDTNGRFREPAELLRRTPATDPLFGVEAFVRPEFDTEQIRPLLIKLGVRDTPAGPGLLLERLRALATVPDPPVHEVDKWCRRLDQMLGTCSTTEIQRVKEAFSNEQITLTSECAWVHAHEVFLAADEDDAPGAAIIHPALRDLSMWPRIGVAERPTAELAMRWLATIPPGKKLSQDELRRVRALLPRYAERIWAECRHWLNLDGEWAPTDSLSYKLTMQTLIPWSNLFRPIKQRTADMQKLSGEVCERPPFSSLPSLSSCIEERFSKNPETSGPPQVKAWLSALGSAFGRIVLESGDASELVRQLGARLAGTKWQVVSSIETTPYIDGTPSGTPRRIDVLWQGSILYVEGKSIAKMAKSVTQELGRVFGRPDIVDAIKHCFERDPDFVSEYIAENFKLAPVEEVAQPEPQKAYTGDAAGASEEAENRDISSPVQDAPKSQDDESDTSSAGASPAAADDTQNLQQGKDDATDPEEQDAQTHRRHRSSPSKPPLIERFARAKGYTRDSDEGRYYHADGGWIERISGASFSWERYSASGELIQCYWVKEHCIEREPLQVEADVWELCNKSPEKYTLLLADPDDAPVEYSGHRLRELMGSGRLELFPASYRLALDQKSPAGQDTRPAERLGEQNG